MMLIKHLPVRSYSVQGTFSRRFPVGENTVAPVQVVQGAVAGGPAGNGDSEGAGEQCEHWVCQQEDKEEPRHDDLPWKPVALKRALKQLTVFDTEYINMYD